MSEHSFHLVCLHCQATNRVPAARLSAAPKCGKCSQSLLTASPHELNAQTANKVIQKKRRIDHRRFLGELVPAVHYDGTRVQDGCWSIAAGSVCQSTDG